MWVDNTFAFLGTCPQCLVAARGVELRQSDSRCSHVLSYFAVLIHLYSLFSSHIQDFVLFASASRMAPGTDAIFVGRIDERIKSNDLFPL